MEENRALSVPDKKKNAPRDTHDTLVMAILLDNAAE
jgi:hypothetical protein